VPARQRVKGGG